jgi:hypothetical protein
MKKTLTLKLTVLAVALIMVVGCSPAIGVTTKTTESVPTVKTGIAVSSSIAKSKDVAADADGLAQVDSVVVAVTVGADGKIVKCAIDTAQTKINFSADGKLKTPLDTVYKSKQQLGDEYGMRNASGIKKEWNEQANAFAAYVIGKTVDEVKGIALTEAGAPSSADISSSVTVRVGDYIKTIEKAVANAKDIGSKANDSLGLGVKTTIAKSKDVGEKDGVAQAYSVYAATTYGADGKITGCIIESSQSNVTFSAEGKLTADKEKPLQTKTELGDAYGMRESSKIGKEWHEQAAALATYVTGKTVDEVKGIALTEGKPTDADLTTSVTISIGDYIEVIEQGAANAK